jgi:hypothetical protein
MLRLGDVVPADCYLLDTLGSSSGLHIDQCTLTGESLPVVHWPADTVYGNTEWTDFVNNTSAHVTDVAHRAYRRLARGRRARCRVGMAASLNGSGRWICLIRIIKKRNSKHAPNLTQIPRPDAATVSWRPTALAGESSGEHRTLSPQLTEAPWTQCPDQPCHAKQNKSPAVFSWPILESCALDNIVSQRDGEQQRGAGLPR